MTARVAINGLGRIGRATLKIVLDDPALELVAVNDIADPENLAYLLQYDTVYGRYDKTVRAEGGDLVKVLSWYDNEWGYSAQMVREAKRMTAR